MARFYRTATPRPIDYMYRLNVPLMEKVIEKNDEYITSSMGQLGDLGNAATSFSFLQPDNDAAKKLMDSYNSEISGLSEEIMKNPAAWRSKAGNIRDVGQRLLSDYKTGHISKLIGNYDTYKKAADYIDERVKQYAKDGKGLLPEEGEAYKRSFMEGFSGGTQYDPNTGKYRSINTFSPMDNMNLEEVFEKGLKDLKANSKSWDIDELSGKMYITTDAGTREEVTPQRILSIASEKWGDPRVQQYLSERESVGLMPGVFEYDEQGNRLGAKTPYSFVDQPATKEESAELKRLEDLARTEKNADKKAALTKQYLEASKALEGRQQLQWGDTPIANILRGAMSEFAWSKTTDKFKIKSNPVGIHDSTQGNLNARQKNELDMRWQIAQLKNKEFGDKLEFEKYKWANPHDTKGTTKSTTKKEEPKPPESDVSALSTRSFENTFVDRNGKRVKAVSNEGAVDVIESNKANIQKNNTEIARLDSLLKKGFDPNNLQSQAEHSELQLQRQRLVSQNQQMEGELKEVRGWVEVADKAVLSNHPAATGEGTANRLSEEEIRTYNAYVKEGDVEGKKQMEVIEKLRKQFPNIETNVVVGAEGGGTRNVKEYKNSPQVQNEIDDLAEYQRIRQKVANNRERFYGKMRTDIMDSDAIRISEKDSKDVGDLLRNNSEGLQLFDRLGTKVDKDIDEKGLSIGDSRKDDYKMNFGGKGLIEYMNKNPNVTMTPTHVSPSTAIGNGYGVAKVDINDPNNPEVNGEYYIALTPALARKLGTKFSQSANADVKRVANEMADDEANALKVQLMRPKTNFALDEDGNERVTIPVNATNWNGDQIQFEVDRQTTKGGETAMTVWYNGINEKGQYERMPVERITTDDKGKLDGDKFVFKSYNDWIKNFKEHKKRSAAKAK